MEELHRPDEAGDDVPVPTELLDPITHTVIEEAVITRCGHSFSLGSITQRIRASSEENTCMCPVCGTGPLAEDSLIPNWALRTAVQRYHEQRRNPRQQSADTQQEKRDLNLNNNEQTDDPLHSSRSQLEQEQEQDSLSKEESSPQKHPPPLTTASGTKATFHPPDIELGSSGDNSCCCWECKDCTICVYPRRASGLLFFLFPASCLLCSVSFGKWSSWLSRSLCGTLMVLFVLLLMACVAIDIVWLTVFLTIPALAFVLCILPCKLCK